MNVVTKSIYGADTLLICVDIQERLMTVMNESERVSKNATKILNAARELQLPVLISEQYPKGLGKTSVDASGFDTLEKDTFSIFGNAEMINYITKNKYKKLVFFGIESHVCVFQSAIHALEQKYETIILGDSCSSRDALCHKLAMKNLARCGASIIPTETFIFGSMLGCKDPHFKAISAIVK